MKLVPPYTLILLLVAFLLSLNIYQYRCMQQLLEPSNSNQSLAPTESNPLFIWNDNHKSIPVDGTPILLQYSSINYDTIYIGPLEGSFKNALK
jgi:hypothetical protein